MPLRVSDECGSNLLADGPEEIDQSHGRAAQNCGTAGDKDADLAARRQVWV